MRAPKRCGPSRRRTSWSFRRSDRAEVGVGTLIIFIAMVLVAAVAAAVIIGTSGNLQQRAQETGREAIQEVSSNVHIVSAYGIRNDTSTDVWQVRLSLSLAAGSQDVPLSEMVIRYSDGEAVRIYRYDASPQFNLTWVRGTGTDAVMSSGDLVELTMDMQERALAPRTFFQLQLIPQTGAPAHFAVRTPSTYASDIYVDLKR